MLHKRSVIFRSIYYPGKLNKQIDNGPAESFSISYAHLTASCFAHRILSPVFCCCSWFFQTLIILEEMLCCRKGWRRLQLPLNCFLFLWFLSHRSRALINTFSPPPPKINNQDRTVFSIQLWVFFSLLFFVFNGSNAHILGNLCLQVCVWYVFLVDYIQLAQCGWHESCD